MADETNRIDLAPKARAWLRLMQAGRSPFVNQADGLFGPGSPILPENPEEEPRLYEYQPGVNLISTPRAGYGSPFPILRALSQVKEIRLNIEHIKRQMRGLEWEIVPAEERRVQVGGSAYEPVVETSSVKAFWEKPDGLHDFDSWLNMLIEEILVTDTLTLWPHSESNSLTAELIDGTTIRPLLDFRGRTPRPPIPAYVQILHGVPIAYFSSERLLYRPINIKVNTPYGESPIEWVLTAINTAIRHDGQRIAYFTEGNVPGFFAFLPAEWTETQIAEFQEYFDALLQGDLGRAQKVMFLPHSGQGTPVVPFQNNNMDDTSLDSWLMQVACWAFGNSPAEFGLAPAGTQGLGGAGYGQAQENVQYRSLIGPLTGFLASLFNHITREWLRRPDCKFRWSALGPQEDQLKQAQVDQLYIGSVYTADYVADRMGVPERYRVQPAPATALLQTPGAAELPPSLMPYIKRALQSELTSWKGKALRWFEKGQGPAPFDSDIIPADVASLISDGLEKAGSVEDIEHLFGSLLDRNTALEKTIQAVINDPTAYLKAAAGADLARALEEYFAGLKQRIISASVEDAA